MSEVIIDIGNNLIEIVGCEYRGELVRCKECKHWDTVDGECYADRGIYFPKADDYCSYGERKGADDE